MRTAVKTLGLIVATGVLATACAHNGYGSYGGGYSDGQYSRDYRSGNGYRGTHSYARRLPNGLVESDRIRLDPWLNHTREGNRFVRDHYNVTRYSTVDEDTAENANVFFRRWADINRDYRLTDEEIRNALTHSANNYGLPHNDGARPHPDDRRPHAGHNPAPRPHADRPHLDSGPVDREPIRRDCHAGGMSSYIGEYVSQSIVDEAMSRSGARELRWIPEGSAVTMDYRADRLNIEHAQDGRILDIKCG